MRLSKNIVFNASAYSLAENTQITQDIMREEYYEIQIMQNTVHSVYLLPEQLEEYAYGWLIAKGIIKNKSDVTFMRICDANKYHIQLKAEINDKIYTAGSVEAYIADLPRESWGDIISIRSMVNLSESELRRQLDAIRSNELLSAFAPMSYYAAFIQNGELISLSYDTYQPNTLYKMMGLAQTLNTGYIITNCTANMENITLFYKMQVPLVVTAGLPTNGALVMAKKAGIALVTKPEGQSYLLFADSARRLRDD